jgi:hypothetical protein
MSGNQGKHQSAQPILGSDIQVGPMSDECFDELPMTGMCRQHEGRLSMAVAGIHVYTPSKNIKDELDVTPSDRILT